MKTKVTKLVAMCGLGMLSTTIWMVMLLTANTVEAKKIEPEKELPSPQNFIPRASTTYTLYDGGLGGTPDTQSFLYLNLPTGTATQSESGGVTTLDTKVVSMGAYAGYFGDRVTVPQIPVLDRTEGYTLTFTVQVEAEAHGNNNRAGFSVIVLGNDNKGIEMAFWENEIWVQDDDADDPADLFTHAEGVVFSPTVALETYKLIILGDSYSLVVSDTTILSGTLRDYTNFSGPIDPYETPNFIFMGDNTTSAEARIKLSFVSVTTLEKPAPVDYQAYLPFVHHP